MAESPASNNNPYGLSAQDFADLQFIRGSLKAGDPRLGKLDTLLGSFGSMPSERLGSDPAGAVLARQGISGGTVPGPQPIGMQQSGLPSAIHAATGVLPAIGGLAGGILAAPAGGIGAVAGAGLGAAGGQSARLGINSTIFGAEPVNKSPGAKYENPSPISGEGLKQTGLAGLFGAASQVPGALMQGSGNAIISRMAAARGMKQTGNVAAGLEDASPIAASSQGVKNALSTAASRDAQALRSTLASSQQPINIDSVVAQARQGASSAVTNSNGILKAVPKQLEIAISAAKQRAGITGATATPQQLFDFMQELRAYKGDPGKAAGVVQDLAKQIYQEGGVQLRSAAPGSDAILARLTNYHAAKDALSNYGLGRAGAAAVSAATHPRTTAALSPFVTGAAAAGGDTAIDRSRRLISSLTSQITR